jgi:hypothetical protein
MTLDPQVSGEDMRGMFASEARKCDIIVLTFSLINPASLQHAMRCHRLMAGAGASLSSSKPERDPIVFLVGTLRELRDAALLGKREAYHELVRHYVNQKLMSTDDAKAFASGQARVVSEASIREAMLAVNATSYTEVCFLPEVGNVAKIFSAIAEKSRTIRRSSSSKPSRNSANTTHRRSRSSVSSAGGAVALEDPNSDDESDSEAQSLAGLAEARFPDTFVMGEHAEKVCNWLGLELATLVRPVTPRDGLSRSAYKLLLSASPAGSSSDSVRCPAEGYHRFEWPSGDTYVGTWRSHMYDGQGVLQLVSGASYTGGFVAGLFSGQGLFQSPDKSSYNGSWVEGKRNGRGNQMYADGSRYVGYWRDDMRHGEGVLSYVNGTIYAGGFKDDQFHGHGRYTFNTGSTYEGEWKEGKKTGQGTLHRFDGSLRKLT